jgi:hypothetical protein
MYALIFVAWGVAVTPTPSPIFQPANPAAQVVGKFASFAQCQDAANAAKLFAPDEGPSGLKPLWGFICVAQGSQ